MTAELALSALCIGLMGLLIFQQVYLTIVINRLVDKVMSRSYAEYAQANQKVPARIRIPVEDEPVEDLNQLFGLGPQI